MRFSKVEAAFESRRRRNIPKQSRNCVNGCGAGAKRMSLRVATVCHDAKISPRAGAKRFGRYEMAMRARPAWPWTATRISRVPASSRRNYLLGSSRNCGELLRLPDWRSAFVRRIIGSLSTKLRIRIAAILVLLESRDHGGTGSGFKPNAMAASPLRRARSRAGHFAWSAIFSSRLSRPADLNQYASFIEL